MCWIDNDTKTDGVVFRNSGDVVERDSCGQIMYHGRQDEQIKRNGKRLNLRELEQVCLMFTIRNTHYGLRSHDVLTLDVPRPKCKTG